MVSTHVSWQAKVHTFLMMGDPHCFHLRGGFSSLLPSCCVFNSESTCGGHSRLSSPIHESHSLSSVCVHIHSSSALFVGTVNLAKEVVGKFHLLWIVRALAKWQGGGYLLGYFPSLHGYIPRAASLSSDLCCCRTCIVVVESVSLSNPRYGCCGSEQDRE